MASSVLHVVTAISVDYQNFCPVIWQHFIHFFTTDFANRALTPIVAFTEEMIDNLGYLRSLSQCTFRILQFVFLENSVCRVALASDVPCSKWCTT